MLKISSFLEDAAKNAAIEMLQEGLSESFIPEMPSCLISLKNTCPAGFVALGEINFDGKSYFIFQKF